MSSGCSRCGTRRSGARGGYEKSRQPHTEREERCCWLKRRFRPTAKSAPRFTCEVMVCSKAAFIVSNRRPKAVDTIRILRCAVLRKPCRGHRRSYTKSWASKFVKEGLPLSHDCNRYGDTDRCEHPPV